MKHLLALTTLSLLLVSCVSTYQNPKGDIASLAVIKNHYKGLVLDPTVFSDEEKLSVYTINGKPVSYNWTWTTETKKIVVAPGKQDLEIIVSSRENTVSRYKIVRVQFVANAGKTYALRGTFSGPDVKFWIEDLESKSKALPVQTIEMSVAQREYAPTIIFLPAG